jgi:hypothetical protein
LKSIGANSSIILGQGKFLQFGANTTPYGCLPYILGSVLEKCLTRTSRSLVQAAIASHMDSFDIELLSTQLLTGMQSFIPPGHSPNKIPLNESQARCEDAVVRFFQ